jgi:hypothetical protein
MRRTENSILDWNEKGKLERIPPLIVLSHDPLLLLFHFPSHIDSEFVVNIISEWFAEAANLTCGAFDRGVDEFALSGLTPLPSDRVRAPRVKESAVQFECKLRAT